MAGPAPQGPAPRRTAKSAPRKGRGPRPEEAEPAPAPDMPPVIHVADDVVAKIAAHYARTVPGVAELRAGLAGTMANLAGRVTRTGPRDAGELSTDGVAVTVDDEQRTAAVTIDAVMQLGMPLLEVAEHVQQLVAANIEHATGLAAVITVNIVDVSDEEPEPTEGSGGGVPPAASP